MNNEPFWRNPFSGIQFGLTKMESVFDLLRRSGVFELLLIALIYLYHNLAYEVSEHPQKPIKKRMIGCAKQPMLPVYDLDCSFHSQESIGVLPSKHTIHPAPPPVPIGLIETRKRCL